MRYQIPTVTVPEALAAAGREEAIGTIQEAVDLLLAGKVVSLDAVRLMRETRTQRAIQATLDPQARALAERTAELAADLLGDRDLDLDLGREIMELVGGGETLDLDDSLTQAEVGNDNFSKLDDFDQAGHY